MHYFTNFFHLIFETFGKFGSRSIAFFCSRISRLAQIVDISMFWRISIIRKLTLFFLFLLACLCFGNLEVSQAHPSHLFRVNNCPRFLILILFIFFILFCLNLRNMIVLDNLSIIFHAVCHLLIVSLLFPLLVFYPLFLLQNTVIEL